MGPGGHKGQPRVFLLPVTDGGSSGLGRRHTLRKADQLPLWACAFGCAVSAMFSIWVQGGAVRGA